MLSFEPIALGSTANKTPYSFQQCSDLGQRGMRGCKSWMQSHAAIRSKSPFASSSPVVCAEKLQLRTYPGRRSRGACPPDRVSVWIDTDYLTIGKSLCDRDADTANATTNIQDATTLFEALDDIGRRLEPLADEAVLILRRD